MKITIDGRTIQVEGRPTLLEIARKNDIFISSLCDHPKLKPFTGCRLCLVEIKGRKDYAPACGTYPEEGMEVTTETPDLRELRKGILELILSEHPFACLICGEKPTCEETKSTIRKVGEVTGCVLCPQNGRCDLQRVVMDLGIDSVRYPALYKDLDVRKEDPFFDRDPNTCILCGKCIRVCEEIRGASVLNFVSRGSHTVVGTALDNSLLASGCQFCGACVDICPTAALVERAVRPQILPEETELLICPYCSQGCTLEAAVLNDQVLYTRPAESGPVNRGQACMRGRFLLRDTLHSGKRIEKPWIRKNGSLEPAEWDKALEAAATRLNEAGEERTAVGFGRQLGLEDVCTLMTFAKDVLGTAKICSDSATSVWARLDRLAKEHGLETPLPGRLESLVEADLIIDLGADLPQAHPMAWLRVQEALGRGAKLLVSGAGHHPVTRHATLFLKTRPGGESFFSAGLSIELLRRGAKASEFRGFDDFRKSVSSPAFKKAVKEAGLSPEEISAAADLIAAANSPVILFDSNAGRGPRGDLNLAAIWNLALLSRSRFIPLGSASNDRGVFELELALGCESERNSPASLRDWLRDGEVMAVVLAGAPFGLGENRPGSLICLDTHWSPLAEAADVVLPAAAFGEVEATFVNTEGRMQTSRAAVPRRGDSRPDREIIAALAAKMGAEKFEVADARTVLARPSVPGSSAGPAASQEAHSRSVGFIPLKVSRGDGQAGSKGPFLLSVRQSGDVYGNFEAARHIGGLGRVRPPGRVFLHPGDMERIGVEENGEVEILAAAGGLAATARISKTLPRGTAEIALSGLEPGSGEFLTAGIVPVKIRRKS